MEGGGWGGGGGGVKEMERERGKERSFHEWFVNKSETVTH